MQRLKKIPPGFHNTHLPLSKLAEELEVGISALTSVLNALGHLPPEHEAMKITGGKIDVVWTPNGSFLHNSSTIGLKKLFSEFEVAGRIVRRMRESGIEAPSRFPALVKAGIFGNVPFISSSKMLLVHKSIYETEEFERRRRERKLRE